MLNRYLYENKTFWKDSGHDVKIKKLLLARGAGIWKENQQIGKDEGLGVSKGWF